MKILVTGKGGREHALLHTLERASPSPLELFSWPGSDAIAHLAEIAPCESMEDLVPWMAENGIDLCIAGEESHLAAGLADHCAEARIAVWGPTRAAARLESSKAFAKDFMQRHGIPTAGATLVRSPEALREAVTTLPVVLKFDGLAAGKGVSVCADEPAVEAFIRQVWDERRFGDGAVLVEECLSGPEVSVICAVADGTFVPFTAARDYKRLLDGDAGANTGGMGAVASNSLLDEALWSTVQESIIDPTVDGLQKDGLHFRGFLYFGLMLTRDGPQVLEYNCRFGDPEAQAVLPLLEGDFPGFLFEGAHGRLPTAAIRFTDAWSACVVLASAEYPEAAGSGRPIGPIEPESGVQVFHSGTRRVDGDRFETNGGRVLALNARGATREQAVDRVYAAIPPVAWPDAHYRRDIGRLHFES